MGPPEDGSTAAEESPKSFLLAALAVERTLSMFAELVGRFFGLGG